MNYRHQFHAGNFADVMKHALLVRLLRAMQKKEKGFLYLDTHAGRGGYDLTAAATGDTLARKPEWPEGIGRLAERSEDLPATIAEYWKLAAEFSARAGGPGDALRFYPGSPWFAQQMARPQDRVVLSEKHPDEFFALSAEFRTAKRVVIHEMDGYTALRAMLPPVERRALTLIDPPFEAQNEFAQIATALGDGLKRLEGGVFAVWYPLTQRARVDDFFDAVVALRPPPTLFAELTIAGETAPVKMNGCGLLIINPPWQFDREAAAMLEWLAPVLAQSPGGGSRVTWLVPEKS